MDKIAKANRTRTDVIDTVSPVDVSWYNIVPPRIATNEGGATPANINNSTISRYNLTTTSVCLKALIIFL